MSNQNRDVEADERAKHEDDDDDGLKEAAAPRSGNRTISVAKRAKGKSPC